MDELEMNMPMMNCSMKKMMSVSACRAHRNNLRRRYNILAPLIELASIVKSLLLWYWDHLNRYFLGI